METCEVSRKSCGKSWVPKNNVACNIEIMLVISIIFCMLHSIHVSIPCKRSPNCKSIVIVEKDYLAKQLLGTFLPKALGTFPLTLIISMIILFFGPPESQPTKRLSIPGNCRRAVCVYCSSFVLTEPLPSLGSHWFWLLPCLWDHAAKVTFCLHFSSLKSCLMILIPLV